MGIFKKKYWNNRYRSKTFPWVTHRRDVNLKNTLEEFEIPASKVLELGCGYGDNAIWLAKQGFEVTAIDLSEEALLTAGEKAEKEGVKIQFLLRDFLTEKIESRPFDLVFDRGCFHSFDFKRKRKTFSKKVAFYLREEGLWLSLAGSRDAKNLQMGPPKLTALEIVKGVEGFFKILQLKAVVFDSDSPDPRKAWSCLMKKR